MHRYQFGRCDLRNIIQQFIPANRHRTAWFAHLEDPGGPDGWTVETIAAAKVAVTSQPVAGAVILHAYRIHDECEHFGDQPTGPEESRVVLAVENGEGEIEPVHDPYAYDTWNWHFIGATDAGEELEPEVIEAAGPHLRMLARHSIKKPKKAS